MKKALSLVLAALLLTALLAVGVTAGDLQEGVAVYGTPTVDGKIDEWANVPAYTVDRLKTGTATTITAQFRVMWDESHLYTLIEVKDPDHSFNGGPSVGDGCEVYVDLNNEKSGGFDTDTQAYTAVCANDPSYLSFDGSSAGKSYLEWGTVCAAEETADGYNYEFVMDTATDFEVALSEGKVIGFDIQINDQNENSDSRTAAYGWCDDTDMAWQSPASYGNITLTKDGAAPAADTAAEAPAEEAPAAEAPTAEGYPSSGYTPKDGSAIITGEIIGLELGWDGTAACGRTAAFDGNIETFFDPLGTGDGWAGIDAGSEYTLTAILIHPRTTFLDRFSGGTIEGSMDPEFENAVEIWSSVEAASAVEWQIIDQSDFDEVGSFRYYRYINYTNHGDVGDIELYGYASDGEYEAQEAARQEAAAKAAEEAAAKKAEAEAAKAAEAEAKAAEEAAKAAEEAANAAAEAGEAVEEAADTAAAAVEEAKSGCGSFIGGGMIVLVSILGCGWITSRKH